MGREATQKTPDRQQSSEVKVQEERGWRTEDPGQVAVWTLGGWSCGGIKQGRAGISVRGQRAARTWLLLGWGLPSGVSFPLPGPLSATLTSWEARAAPTREEARLPHKKHWGGGAGTSTNDTPAVQRETNPFFLTRVNKVYVDKVKTGT